MLFSRNTFTLIVLLVAAGFVTPPATAADTLNVVTSVAPITNIVQNVGGNNVSVTGIVPDGTDSHTFEPQPTDAKLLSAADIIIMNGLDLETPTIHLAEKVRKKNTPIVELATRTIEKKDWMYDFSFPRGKGHPNPHLWPNIAMAMRYAEITRDALIALDPAHKDSYSANATAYLAKLGKLDEAIFTCVKSIPAGQRKLVTYHDSFAYFAPRYGMTVIGAIQPADFHEPSPREVMRIIDQLKKEKVPAIFGSEVFPSRVLEQIAREANTTYVDQLADDELPGPAGSSEHTFIGMMKGNMAYMAAALGGNKDCVTHVDATNIVPAP